MKKVIVGIILCSLLMTTTVFARTESTYNTPNTTTEDSDKSSPCEVVANINYAYYVSMPASLTLEPFDEDKIKSIRIKSFINDEFGGFESISDGLMCNYQVKAKSTTEGIGDKYIMIQPSINTGLASQGMLNGILTRGYVLDNEDFTDSCVAVLFQDKAHFGKIDSENTKKLDSDKWSLIDGCIVAIAENQGLYKGSFEFVYGLVDNIEYYSVD